MYSTKTYEIIKENILSNISGIDKREGSFINDMISPIAMQFDDIYRECEKLLSVMFLENCTGEYLEKRANEYGILRKIGSKAEGKITFICSGETVIPKKTLIGTSTKLLYETKEECIVGSDLSATADIIAKDIGSKYNVIANAVNNIPVSIPGVISVKNENYIEGGADIETDEELLKRVLAQIQNPATSGNSAHYKMWALEISGIIDAKIFPLKNGAGTVGVMPITSDYKSPSALKLEKILNNIELKKPIGAEISIFAPTEVPINIIADIVKKIDYTIQSINEKYNKLLSEYIKSGVFKIYNVDFYKCLSLLYEVEGVVQVVNFKINDMANNVSIGEEEIQVIGEINIKEVIDG